ncbi:phosphohydrolase [Pseudomonas sp.]|uniref:phosphohydrolase n=1 Tax=Pseudomonas sp. TaxID=306 RepID=UPI00272FF36E|nr:phosphohydrolase [Pseudomonas sp.]MDP2447646.1 phosphohydrolase [Pseudomonas sp.]MDZ4334306.1 phosphohydrolase [Pseudomonas sp.]
MTRIILQSAREFDLLKPRADLITTLDIAHALSLICRFNGHCNRHYSVAQHSLLVADIVESQGHGPEIQLQALLHDAAEAYVGDLVRPLKYHLRRQACGQQSDFDRVEERVWEAICDQFELEPELPFVVHDADMIALATERRELLPDHPSVWDCLHGITPHRIELENWTPGQARQAFHDRLLDLLATTHRARAAA